MTWTKLGAATFAGLLTLSLMAGCGTEETVAYDSLRLSIRLEGTVTPPTRMVARALTHTNEGAELSSFEIDLTGRDLTVNPLTIDLGVNDGSPWATETVLSLVAYHADTPVATYADRFPLTGTGELSAPLTPLAAICDLDGDGYANCLAAPECCTKDQADFAHDCADEDPAIWPLSPNEGCRTCTPEDVCEPSNGGQVCDPSCTGRSCGDDGCGGSCGTCTDDEQCISAGVCVLNGMTHVPGDVFVMGCNPAVDSACEDSEYPHQTVDVPAFQIGNLEVTNDAYDDCVESGSCTPAHYDDGDCFVVDGDTWSKGVLPGEFRGGLKPVVCVTHDQAEAYCRWQCPDCDLCTEAEWEKAARGGCNLYEGQNCADAMPLYPWGNAQPVAATAASGSPVGNFSDESGASRYGLSNTITGYADGAPETTNVGQYPAGRSRYGVFDLAGNVWEWTADCWEPTLEGQPGDGTARLNGDCSQRVRRGGGWISSSSDIRASRRDGVDMSFATDILGIRCCRHPN